MLSDYTDKRDNNFNLIRFIAASLVLFGHSFPVVGGPKIEEPLWNAIEMTFPSIAVDSFFVISGFLIASSFFSRKKLIAYIWARILRIYPALTINIIFCVFVLGIFFTAIPVSEYLTTTGTYKYFLKNVTLFWGVNHHLPGVFQDIPLEKAVNGSLWTLPYEVKMYLYLAIIGLVSIIIQKRLGFKILNKIFISIAILSTMANIANHFFAFAPVQFLRFFAMFFVGSTFYVCRDKIVLSTKLFFFMGSLLLLSTMNKDIFFLIYNISIAYLLLYIAYIPSGIIRNFNKIGDYSYGMYIYAFPVQQSMSALVENISISLMIIMSFCVTLMFSILSWHLVEKRCLQMKDKYVVLGDVMKNRKFAVESNSFGQELSVLCHLGYIKGKIYQFFNRNI